MLLISSVMGRRKWLVVCSLAAAVASLTAFIWFSKDAISDKDAIAPHGDLGTASRTDRTNVLRTAEMGGRREVSSSQKSQVGKEPRPGVGDNKDDIDAGEGSWIINVECVSEDGGLVSDALLDWTQIHDRSCKYALVIKRQSVRITEGRERIRTHCACRVDMSAFESGFGWGATYRNCDNRQKEENVELRVPDVQSMTIEVVDGDSGEPLHSGQLRIAAQRAPIKQGLAEVRFIPGKWDCAQLHAEGFPKYWIALDKGGGGPKRVLVYKSASVRSRLPYSEGAQASKWSIRAECDESALVLGARPEVEGSIGVGAVGQPMGIPGIRVLTSKRSKRSYVVFGDLPARVELSLNVLSGPNAVGDPVSLVLEPGEDREVRFNVECWTVQGFLSGLDDRLRDIKVHLVPENLLIQVGAGLGNVEDLLSGSLVVGEFWDGNEFRFSCVPSGTYGIVVDYSLFDGVADVAEVIDVGRDVLGIAVNVVTPVPVRGVVVDDEGRGVAGALVWVVDNENGAVLAEEEADDDGCFAMGVARVSALCVVAGKFGESLKSEPVELNGIGDIEHLKLTLMRCGSVRGKVCDEDGAGCDVEVHAFRCERGEAGVEPWAVEGLVVPTGRFVVEGLREGLWDIVAKCERGLIGIKRVRVGWGDEQRDCNVELHKGGILYLSLSNERELGKVRVLAEGGALTWEGFVSAGSPMELVVPTGQLTIEFGGQRDGRYSQKVQIEPGGRVHCDLQPVGENAGR